MESARERFTSPEKIKISSFRKHQRGLYTRDTGVKEYIHDDVPQDTEETYNSENKRGMNIGE